MPSPVRRGRGEPALLVPRPAGDDGQPPEGAEDDRSVTRPDRLLRLAMMTQALRSEIQQTDLDETARRRLAAVFNRTVDALHEVLSEDLREEFDHIELPLPEAPTEAELRVAHAQLVGWLEGLFHGIRTTMLAHQLATQEELAQAYQQGLEAAHQESQVGVPGHYL